MQAELDAWMARAAGDPELAAAATGLTCGVGIEVGDARAGLRLCGRPEAIAPDTPDIRIRATPDALAALMQPLPPPGLHAFGAFLRHDLGVTAEAGPLVLAQALAALERLVEIARPDAADPPELGYACKPASVRGRFLPLTNAQGHHALLHLLEAGEGPPILFLHTAGADSRQFLHQLADTDLQARHRMLAFDLPWHGLSSGEDGCESTAGYVLTEAAYLDWCVCVLEAEAGGPALIVGCSMGAAMALTLAARRPDLVAGFVALEAPMSAPGRLSPMLAHARVANGLHNPAYVRAMLGPASPRRYRDAACAIYAQGRPGVYAGDLRFYSEEYSGARIAEAVRRSGLRGALLTGAYDYSASPANTRRLHAAIASDTVRMTEMPGLGHFPMIEHPRAFRPFLRDALDWVTGR
ncbi:MAG: alpha/beta fold hydrolase [Alkalilacustris sp.]